MTRREIVLNALNYKGNDNMPAFYSATPEFNQKFENHIKGKGKLDLNYVRIEPVYCGPELKKYDDGSWEGIWGERYKNIPYQDGTYPESVFQPFRDIIDENELEKFRFPAPDWYDYSGIKQTCIDNKEYAVVFGGAGRVDLINGTARTRGVEQVLMDIATEDPVYLKLIEKRFTFFYGVFENVLKAAEGMIDIIYFGDDYGTQNGLLISPSMFKKIFRPYVKEFIALGHKYGAKAMMHSCGSVRELIPEFIDAGLDILDAVQVEAVGMDIKELHNEFYGKIAFHGSMSVQSLLPFGTVEDVRREVELRKELFKDGGMILGPTHAIQPNTPVENVLEMYKCNGSFF